MQRDSSVRVGLFRSPRPAGRAVLGIVPGEEATIPLAFLPNHEITLTATFRYANTCPGSVLAIVRPSAVNMRQE